jgi:DUF1009 family protein
MLALIAGQGRLPVLICERLQEAGTPFLICELEGIPSACEPELERIRFRIERLGGLLKTLKKRGVEAVCFAGKIARPKVDPSAIDMATLPLVPRITRAIRAGDDGALREALAIFTERGFTVKAAHELVPELLPQTGVLTRAQPSEDTERDAARGAAIVAALGAADLGQACVVARGQALALEGLPGTDWMLESLGQRADGHSSLPAHCPERGGILYKAPKPTQDRRIDLPAIGPETARRAVQAGLDGLVIEAQGVLVLDRDKLLAELDDAGLFLWVREARR